MEKLGPAIVIVTLLCTACGGGTEVGDDAGVDGETSDGAMGDVVLQEAHEETLVDAVGDTDPEAEIDEAGEPLTVMTYNVLCSFCDTEGIYAPWETRLAYFQDIMDRHAPDLVGLQELTFVEEVEQMVALLPGFEAVYYESDTFMDYPDATVLYDAERFELVEEGFYWLSPTPDEPFSIGFAEGAQFFRLVTWVLLEQKGDGTRFFFATTHFDNNPPSQDKSSPLVLERSEPKASEHPFILNGDFNSQTHDPAFVTLVEGVDGEGFHFDDTWSQATVWETIYNQDPPPVYDEPGRIDHIFTAGGTFTVHAWYVDMTVYGAIQQYPSDHWPVVAVLTLFD